MAACLIILKINCRELVSNLCYAMLWISHDVSEGRGSIKPFFIYITDNVSVNILTPKMGGLGPCFPFFSLGLVLVQDVCFRGCTLPKTKSSRLKIGHPTPQKETRKYSNQSLFRCYVPVSFREGTRF